MGKLNGFVKTIVEKRQMSDKNHIPYNHRQVMDNVPPISSFIDGTIGSVKPGPYQKEQRDEPGVHHLNHCISNNLDIG